MKLEDQACHCGYKTANKKSFSNHTRFGCNAGRDYSREHYLNNKADILFRSRKRYALKREEINEKRRDRYHSNPLKELIKVRAYTRTPYGRIVSRAKWLRYRSRKSGGDVTSKEIKKILADNQECALCKSTELLEIDHITPISKGGKHFVSNLQILCRSCNRRKGSKCN